jgi:methylenetetrahydrofolate reductase (NADPH)
MECPKGLRNGPCGGSTPGKCYVDETRKCIWYCIFERAYKMNREEKLLEVLPPLDWEKVGTETWGDVIRQVKETGTSVFIKSLFLTDKAVSGKVWDNVFRTVRQPEWWNGDSEFHTPKYSEPASELERRLRNGEFVVTTEIIPPLASDTDKLRKNIGLVQPFVSAVNFTDNASALSRMSGMVCCKVSNDLKAEPVLQITARDNSRYGLQSNVIGANELGIKNILCISGDSPKMGPSPLGKMDILDLDSVQMLWILRRMRDEDIYLDGRQIKHPPKFFLGAAASPFASEPKFQAIREHKKVNAGAQFLQTNLVFEAEGLNKWLEQLDKRNILDKVFILVGIAPIRNLKIAQFLHNEIPGVSIPGNIMKRIETAGESAQEEGIQIALELIDSIRKSRGVHGIHLMTLGYESIVQRIVKESGLMKNQELENQMKV